MMRLHFTDRPKFLSDPNDEEFQLERKVDNMSTLSPREQRGLLYNDTHNYVMSRLIPFEGWYDKRSSFIREYATLNWLALGEHLAVTHSHSMETLCKTIDVMFQQLMITLPQFSLSLFCSALSKVDHLFHCLLPSHYNTSDNPDVHSLLTHCGQI